MRTVVRTIAYCVFAIGCIGTFVILSKGCEEDRLKTEDQADAIKHSPADEQRERDQASFAENAADITPLYDSFADMCVQPNHWSSRMRSFYPVDCCRVKERLALSVREKACPSMRPAAVKPVSQPASASQPVHKVF